jgi:hypothetical protein
MAGGKTVYLTMVGSNPLFPLAFISLDGICQSAKRPDSLRGAAAGRSLDRSIRLVQAPGFAFSDRTGSCDRARITRCLLSPGVPPQ